MRETNVLVWSDGSVRQSYPDDMDPVVRERIEEWPDFIERAAENYPNDLNSAIAEHLNEDETVVARTASLHDPHQGASPELLEWADAVVWWGHLGQKALDDETVSRVEDAVRDGVVGAVVLHSANNYRPFTGLIDASGEVGDAGHRAAETVEVEAPEHPIASGIEPFEMPDVEWYDEPFDIPEPDTVVFRSTFSNGATFRSGVTFTPGDGRLFYFSPGDELWRAYHDPSVCRILANAVEWVADE